MNFIATKLKGCFILEPKIIIDERGYFMESFNQKNNTNMNIIASQFFGRRHIQKKAKHFCSSANGNIHYHEFQ